jgi:protocatechuate 3,4-dioxygenase beta subunit
MDSHGFRVTNRCLPDLLRAMTATEARAVTSGVVVDDGGCTLVSGAAVWRCDIEGDDYRVTLPDGRSAVGGSVSAALAAARGVV